MIISYFNISCHNEENMLSDANSNRYDSDCEIIDDHVLLSDLSEYEKVLYQSERPTYSEYLKLTGGDIELELRICRCQRYYGKPCIPILVSDYIDHCQRDIDNEETSMYYHSLRESIVNKGIIIDLSKKKVKAIIRPTEHIEHTTMPVFLHVEYGDNMVVYFHKGRKCDPHPNIDIYEINGVQLNIQNGIISF